MGLAVPFGRYVPHRKKQQLQKRIIGREHRPSLCNLPQLPVEAFYGIGCIDQAPHLVWIPKEGCELIPVVPSALHCRRVLPAPFRIERIQLLPCLILGIGFVNLLEIRNKALHVLGDDEARGGTYLVYYAPLDVRLRVDGGNGIAES